MMNQKNGNRRRSYTLGTIGLVAGLFFGRLCDLSVTIAPRGGVGTAGRNALGKVFIGGVVGLLGGYLLALYLGQSKDDVIRRD